MDRSSISIETLSPEKKQALLALMEKRKKTTTLQKEKKVPLCPRDRKSSGSFPLSYSQQRLWFINQLEPESNAYNIPLAYRLTGVLDKEILKKSLGEILKRHEILRTYYQFVDEQPVQIIEPYTSVPMEEMDISHLSQEESDAAALEIARCKTRKAFDLSKGTMIRFQLIRKSETEHIFVITIHHIAFDGWSIDVFLKELAEIYDSYILGKEHHLEELKIQYADYAMWQREWLKGELVDRQLGYWKQQLTNKIQVIDLPTDRPRPKIRTVRGDAQPFELTASLSRELKALSVRENCTLFMTMLTVLNVFLYRYTHQEWITVGSPIGNRNHPEVESLMGFFINTLVLCTETGDDPVFLDLLKRVQGVTLGAYENQDIPFEKLVEELQPERDLSRTVFYQVMFNFLNVPKSSFHLENLVVSPFELGGSSTNVDLNLYVWEDSGVIKGTFEYNKDLFNAETIQRFITQYTTLLEEVVRNPAQHLSEIPMLTVEEQHKVLVEWNDNNISYPDTRGVHRFFERQANKTPNLPAVFFENDSYTYQQLNERANQLAYFLIEQGVKNDVIVGLFIERSLDLMVGLMGILKSGGAYVPLDTKYPPDKIGAIVKETKTPILITQKALLNALPKMDGIKIICIDEDWNRISNFGKENPSIELSPQNLLYVLFTSGSTGQPKGVMIEHGCYLNYLQGVLKKLDVNSPMNFAIVTTFAADLGSTNIFVPLSTGGQLHILSYERATDPKKFAEYFRQYPIDAMKLVPSHFDALNVDSNLIDIIPVQKLVFAGEACTWDLVAKVREANPRCNIQNHYGPTETTVSALGYEIPPEIPEYAKNIVPIGRPLGNVKAYILDKHQKSVPMGAAGELYIGGPGVARGYLNRPDLTEEKFLPDPFQSISGGRMYRTGDMVRFLPDGNIEFLGRADRQIKIRGYRIDPEDIEGVIKEHPEVMDAVVVMKEIAPGNKKLVAYLVPYQKVDIAVLRKSIKKTLPEYMIPSSFSILESIPLNNNGKVDYMSLPAPDGSIEFMDENYTPPRNDMEEKIASIWKEVLDVPRVGIDDNFFELGGESFKAIQVVRRISSSLSVIEIFKYPTIRELIQRITKEKEDHTFLLHELTKPIPSKGKRISFICVPYGGGSAISYQPLANDLPKDCSLYAVQIPGRDFSCPDEKLETMDEVAKRCMEEIRQKVSGPVALYGQCLGGALCIKLAYMMEEQGMNLVGIFQAGNFPTPRLQGKWFQLWSKIFPSDRWISNRLYKEILRSIGGPMDANGNQAEQDSMIRSLRHDNREAEDYYTQMFSIPELRKLRAPITCVIGERDRTTEFYQERYREWDIFSDHVNLKVIEGAGHFFQKHQPEILSDIICHQVDDWQDFRIRKSKGTINHSNCGMEVLQGSTKEILPEKMGRQPSMKLFLFIAIGQIISMIGTGLSGFALGFWVYKQTGIVSYFALISVFSLLPSILLSPVAGALADRWDKRKIMIISDTLAALGMLIVAVLLWEHQLQIWHIYIAATISSIASAFQRPAFLASIAQIAPKRYLGQANGISQIGVASATMLAPILGGLLISMVDLYGVVFIDFISFGVSITSLLMVTFPDTLFKKHEESFVKEITGGWKYIIKRKSLVVMVIFFIITNFLMSLSTVLVTPAVLSFTTAKTLGIVVSANGIGLLIGSFIMSLWGGTKRRAEGMIGFVILSGISLVFIGLRESVVLATIGFFGFGLSIAFIDSHWQILIQSKVGLELQARVFATNEMLAFMMRPLAFFLAGPLADKVFEPFMSQKTPLAKGIGMAVGNGTGRGMGLILVLTGIILTVWGYLGFKYGPLRYMEDILPDAIPDAVILKDKDKIQELADKKLSERNTKSGHAYHENIAKLDLQRAVKR